MSVTPYRRSSLCACLGFVLAERTDAHEDLQGRMACSMRAGNSTGVHCRQAAACSYAPLRFHVHQKTQHRALLSEGLFLELPSQLFEGLSVHQLECGVARPAV